MKKIIFILFLLTSVILTQSGNSQFLHDSRLIESDTSKLHQNDFRMYITAGGGFSLNGALLFSFSMEPIIEKHLFMRTGVDIIASKSSKDKVDIHFIPTYSFNEGSSFLIGLGATYYPKSSWFAPTLSLRVNFEEAVGSSGGCELRYPVIFGSDAVSMPQLFIHISFDPLKK